MFQVSKEECLRCQIVTLNEKQGHHLKYLPYAFTEDGITEAKRFPKDEYLVYRVRTRTNEVGQVVHAHYGRIGESFGHYIGLSTKCWFNLNDNDTNLEDAKNR